MLTEPLVCSFVTPHPTRDATHPNARPVYRQRTITGLVVSMRCVVCLTEWDVLFAG